MHCLNCNSENLLCHIQVSLALPLSKKGGTVDLTGFIVKKPDVKAWWDNEGGSTAEDADPRMLRGPIICADCCEEHTYVKGITPSLRKISYADALAKGYDALAAEGKKSEE